MIKEKREGDETYHWYSNGDVVVDKDDGSTFEISAKDASGIVTTKSWDPNGNLLNTTTIYPDRSKTETTPDGTSTYTEPNGNVYTSRGDGSWSSYDKASGIQIEQSADGTKTITKDGQEPVVYPADAGTTTNENSDQDAGVTPTEPAAQLSRSSLLMPALSLLFATGG